MAESNASKFSSKITSDGTIGQGGLAAGVGGTDWQAVKTTNFTAESGKGYFVDTTSGAITATLPASPTVGDSVQFVDYAGTFGTNNLTIDRNGNNIQGNAANGLIETDRQSVTFTYIDSTKGWVPSLDATTGSYGALYVAATGGTVTESGDYKIHTFTGDDCFVVSCAGNATGSNTVDYLVVAGGGGGSAVNSGGGGAGGYRESHSTPVSGCYTASPLATPTGITVTATTYPVTVGGGGTGGTMPNGGGTKGSDSVFSTITSTGGGYGIGDTITTPSPGGSGGGGGGNNCNGIVSGQAGNTPPVSPPQGNPGGNLANPSPGDVFAGGGGGAGGAGPNGGPSVSDPKGADGVGTQINPAVGTPGPSAPLKYFSGGGTGAWIRSPSPRSAGNPSLPGPNSGGGGSGGAGLCGVTGGNGTANSGGGGGGARCTTAGAGGTGIVIIRYKFQ